MAELPLAEPSTADAENALRLILAASKAPVEAPSGIIEVSQVEPVAAVAETPTPQPVETAAEAPTETVEAAVEAAETGADDIAALKARLDGYENQMSKVSQSLQWARDTALRAASERDKYRKVIEQLQGGGEISREQLAEMTAPQAETAGWQPANPFARAAAVTEDPGIAEIDIQRFAIDNRLDDAAMEDMSRWATSPDSGLTARDVVRGDAEQTMRLVYAKYRDYKAGQNTALATAAKTVATTQRAAARAASTVVTTAARPAPSRETAKPIEKMSAVEMEKAGYVKWALDQLAGQRAQ